MQEIIAEDAPYLLKYETERIRQLGMLGLPHIKPLTDFLASMRVSCGANYQIPQFDPCDGGIHARALFLLEAPGPTARDSGFVSSNNPDPTARNLWHLIHHAEIPRADVLIWNIVPWYIGEEGHIRPVRQRDIQEALPYLREMIDLLADLKLIVLVGRKAQLAEKQIRMMTSLPITFTYHPSAQVFNISPEKKHQTQEKFAEIADFLRENKEPNTCLNH